MMLLSAALAAYAAGTVTVEDATYRDAPAIRVKNDACEILVSPSLGRVVEFRSTGGPNVLWTAPEEEFAGKGYRNVGGDKLWYAPQALWNWPPDKAWDGEGLKATRLKDGVALESGKGRLYALKLRREIRLDPYAAKVSFVNTMINVGSKPLKVSLWQVTQVDRPTLVRLGTRATAAQPLGYWLYGRKALDPNAATLQGNELTIRAHPTASYKYGAKGGDGAIVALLPGGETFTSFSPIRPRMTYPDADSAKQVFTAEGGLGYVELEHAAPLETLEPRQAQVQTVTWTLKERA